MTWTTSEGERIFRERFGLIEEVVEAVRRRKGLGAEEGQELYSLVMMRIVEDDFKVLRCFEGRSSWRTYLTVVALRVLLDERTRRWGRWRPSATARRLGATAVRLERRIRRDGWSDGEAVADLEARGAGSRRELEALAAQLPRRPSGRFFVDAEPHLDGLVGDQRAEDRLERGERRRLRAALAVALEEALEDLPEPERRLLELRFARGFTVRRIAELRQVPARSLYSRFDRLLGGLRRRLEDSGTRWPTVVDALGEDGELSPILAAAADEDAAAD